MCKMNKELVIAGIKHLMKKDVNKFADNLATFLRCKEEVLQFLFDGTPEITEDLKKKLIETVEANIKNPNNPITYYGVDFSFNYCNELVYDVTFGCYKYFNPDCSYDLGEFDKDATHTDKRYVRVTMTVALED